MHHLICPSCRNYLVFLPATDGEDEGYAVGCRNKNCAEHAKPVPVPAFRYRPQEIDPAEFLLHNAPLLVHDPTLRRVPRACETCADAEAVHVVIRIQGKARYICTTCNGSEGSKKKTARG